MVYHGGSAREERADLSTARALVALVNGLCSLIEEQPSALRILRYMVLAYSYNIRYVVIGQNPYPSTIVPWLGSAYSQLSGTKDTPTTQIICEHFNESADAGGLYVRNMIRNNWKLLENGYLFVNSDYAKGRDRSDVEKLEIYDMMVEYIFSVCTGHKVSGCDDSVTIIGLGTAAHHIAVIVAARLRASGIKSKTTLDGQPARLSRLTYGRYKVGTQKAYCCLSATTLRVFRGAAMEWTRIQGSCPYVQELSRMASNENNKLNTVFMSTIATLIEQLSEHMIASPTIPTDPKDVTSELTIEFAKHSQRTTQLFYELACALAADASVKETISQKIVASAAATSQFKRVTQSVVESGCQKPVASSQSSISTDVASLTGQTITTVGTRSSMFDALRSPSRAVTASVSSTPAPTDPSSTELVVAAPVPQVPPKSPPVVSLATGSSGGGGSFDILRKKKPPVSVSEPAPALQTPPREAAQASSNSTSYTTPVSSTSTDYGFDSGYAAPEGNGMFASLPRKSFN